MSVRMASMPPTKDRKSPGPLGRQGFTLVEVMVVTLISAFVFAGVLSAYIFLGRGLVRQGHEEELESRGRTTLFYFTQDVSAATAISANFSQNDMVLTTPSASVEYSFQAPTSSQSYDGYLTRKLNAANPTILLTGLASFTFNYLTISAGQSTPVIAPSSATTVKQIQFTYTAMAGASVSGAQSQITVVSPRVIMKNKPSLQ